MARKFRGVVLPFSSPNRSTASPPRLTYSPDRQEGSAYLEYLLELADEFFRVHEPGADGSRSEDKAA